MYVHQAFINLLQIMQSTHSQFDVRNGKANLKNCEHEIV